MTRPLKIAVLASEAVPFIKSGGLADVAGALPKTLRVLGHEVIVILPRYSHIDRAKFSLRPFLAPLGVWMGDTEEWCAVLTATHAGVPFYFIESTKYFERFGLYHNEELDKYQDSGRRFGFFTLAALQLCRDMRFAPEIVHAHDWPTALAPAYLKVWHWNDPVLGGAASVLTIHNLAHQGKWPVEDYNYLGLQQSNFTADKFEDFGEINFLKGGIHYADLVTTVSPTYAVESRTSIGGEGLGSYLSNKELNYWGIINGADYEEWNPTTDRAIPAQYSPEAISGKATCKRELQRRFMLEVNADVPLIGVVSRLSLQKGLDLLAQAIERIVADMWVQFAIL